jgi:RNA polymerase sigma-70 factor (ECF subfamily)
MNRLLMTDGVLLQRALAGDEESFTVLYRRRQGGVYRYALHMCGSAEIAEEVTQETFVALIENGRRFDPEKGALSSFLYGIARNLTMRRLDRERPSEEEFEEPAGTEDLALDFTRRETIDSVRRAVLSLPGVYREAVVLCDLEEVSYQDAAFVLGCPVGTVRSRLSRARTLLAVKLRGVATEALGIIV